jgi:hypothetical protein
MNNTRTPYLCHEKLSNGVKVHKDGKEVGLMNSLGKIIFLYIMK